MRRGQDRRPRLLRPGRDRHLSFAPRRAGRLRRLERHHLPHRPRDGHAQNVAAWRAALWDRTLHWAAA